MASHYPYSQSSSRQLPSLKQRSKNKPQYRMPRLKGIVAVSLALVLCSYMGWSHHAAAQAAAIETAKAAQLAKYNADSKVFTSQVEQITAQYPLVDASISVSTNGLPIKSIGDAKTYDGASIGKLITASAYLHQVAIHKASLQQRMSDETAQSWLQTMIVDSNDIAWQTLNNKLGHHYLEQYAKSHSITDYNADTNSFTASDAALILNKLYDGSLLPGAERNLLLGYMSKANYRNFIVSAVPTENTIYHKVGIDGDYVHDASIIKHGEQQIVLVIFTNGNESYDHAARAELMRRITQLAQQIYFKDNGKATS